MSPSPLSPIFRMVPQRALPFIPIRALAPTPSKPATNTPRQRG